MTERRSTPGRSGSGGRGPGVSEVRAADDPGDPGRFRLLATYLAGRSLGVTEAAAGEAAHTDGRFVFVSAGRPPRLLGAPEAGPGGRPTDKDLRLQVKVSEVPEADDDEEQGEESKILKLFQNPLSNSNALTNFLSKMLGMSRSPGQGNAGGEMPVGSIRRVDTVGPNARPLPAPLHFVDDDMPGPAAGVGGALYPD